MKAILLFAAIFLPAVILMTAPVNAQVKPGHPLYETCRHYTDLASAPAACVEAAREDSESRIFGPEGVLTKTANIITLLAAIAATVVIVIGGIMYVLSGGNGEQVNRSKNTIIFALVGLAVAALGQVIIIFVLNKL